MRPSRYTLNTLEIGGGREAYSSIRPSGQGENVTSEATVQPTDLSPSTTSLILGDPWCKGLLAFVVVIWGFWLWTGPIGGSVEGAGTVGVSSEFAIVASLLAFALLYRRCGR